MTRTIGTRFFITQQTVTITADKDNKKTYRVKHAPALTRARVRRNYGTPPKKIQKRAWDQRSRALRGTSEDIAAEVVVSGDVRREAEVLAQAVFDCLDRARLAVDNRGYLFGVHADDDICGHTLLTV